MPTRAAIGLGSNLGDRKAHLAAATEALGLLGDIVRESSWYETAPVGGPEQGPYLNAVVVLDTELAPDKLMNGLRAIEKHQGRERRERWGPRTLDLDILVYGRRSISEEGLTIPHEEMTNRRFVLEPLLEAWPGVAMPDGTLIEAFLPAVAAQDVVRVGRPEPVSAGAVTFPRWAPLALFVVVGLGAVAIWWILGIFLP